MSARKPRNAQNKPETDARTKRINANRKSNLSRIRRVHAASSKDNR